MHKIRKKQHSFNVALKRARVSGSSCVWLSECCSMAHRLGAVFFVCSQRRPRGRPVCVCGGGLERRCPRSGSSCFRAGWQRGSRERSTLSLCRDGARVPGTDPAVRPLACPLEGCSHTQSTCQSGCTPVQADGKLAAEILTACRPGIPC